MKCRQCDSDSLKLIYTQGNDNEFRFYRCKECYLVNLDLSAGLDQTKYDHKGDQSVTHSRKENQSQERTWQFLKSSLPALPGKRLLDIGCGNAHMLELAQIDGWEIAGIEILPNLAELASRKLGIDIVTSDFQNYQPRSDEEYDLIVMRHVFEHIPDGLAVVRKCLGMLSAGGVIYLELPNIDSFSLVIKRWLSLRGLVKKQYRSDYVPGHCNEYGRRSLHKLAEITGLRLEQWGTYSSKPALNTFYKLFPVATKGRVTLVKE
jgi:2-polyprenyl-3-methyl-5-hydroxy-6-metoxy-1,4-benzoquinol methylase